ncbi:MAG: response regulator transcription factor, partial [Burkholderiales bacterium]|nr:response regulator transcription factor [Burkholderiales bacterium]
MLAFLRHTAHDAVGVENGIELENCLTRFTPDIALLDYNLPGDRGPVLARMLRERYGVAIGIVMVTARTQGVDRIECRRAGADVYLVKPVDFGELLMVIENLVMRLRPAQNVDVPWKLFLARSELVPPGLSAIVLTHQESLLLSAIARAKHRSITREDLIHALGKDPDSYDDRALESCISRLRRKLLKVKKGRNPLHVLRGFG